MPPVNTIFIIDSVIRRKLFEIFTKSVKQIIHPVRPLAQNEAVAQTVIFIINIKAHDKTIQNSEDIRNRESAGNMRLFCLRHDYQAILLDSVSEYLCC